MLVALFTSMYAAAAAGPCFRVWVWTQRGYTRFSPWYAMRGTRKPHESAMRSTSTRTIERVAGSTAGSGSNREASSSQGGSSGSRTPACSPSWACAHAVVLAYELGVVRPGDR